MIDVHVRVSGELDSAFDMECADNHPVLNCNWNTAAVIFQHLRTTIFWSVTGARKSCMPTLYGWPGFSLMSVNYRSTNCWYYWFIYWSNIDWTEPAIFSFRFVLRQTTQNSNNCRPSNNDNISLIPADWSCKDRCLADWDPEHTCHCNGVCSTYGNCCEDFWNLCFRGMCFSCRSV